MVVVTYICDGKPVASAQSDLRLAAEAEAERRARDWVIKRNARVTRGAGVAVADLQLQVVEK